MNKIWLGGAVTALLFCGIIAANSLLFPSVLAMTGESDEVQSVNVEELAELVSSNDETDSGTSINMISEKHAVKIARETMSESNFDVDISSFKYKAQLIEDVFPQKGAIWAVLFYEQDEKDTGSKNYSVSINAMTGKAYAAIEVERFINSSSESGVNITWSDLTDKIISTFIHDIIDVGDTDYFKFGLDTNQKVIYKFSFSEYEAIDPAEEKIALVCFSYIEDSGIFFLASSFLEESIAEELLIIE